MVGFVLGVLAHWEGVGGEHFESWGGGGKKEPMWAIELKKK